MNDLNNEINSFLQEIDSLIEVWEEKALEGDIEALETVQNLLQGKRNAIEAHERLKADLAKRLDEVRKHPELIETRRREACKQGIELCRKLKAENEKIGGDEIYGM